MKSQPNAKGGMYVLNEDIDMKAKVATMARRLKELEMKKVQEVQAIYETSVQAMPCSICQSYEHLVEECPTIPAVREMFGDQANVIAPQQASNLEQAIVNLSKIDNVQYTISRLTNLNIVQEKGKFPSQPHQNPKGIHEVEAQEGESSNLREVKAVITFRSGKEVDQPTSKPKHDGEKPERIVIKEDMMKKHMPPRFLQALHGKKGTNNASENFEVLRQVKCKSPVKYKDPSYPTILVSIGGNLCGESFVGLGSQYKSVKIPRRMIEDVLVQVDKFYYQMDFVVLDMDPVVK
ncbi:hypothetical protein CK203_101125 [Vitis vinifera]|uniref:Uncharacterized protein n=1 Tax=Vitis vinifera TaxID=29760 RepID=A0A438C523_VITVI|nr:hypothetical protein CK203_101125 [Vitis vinifera]